MCQSNEESRRLLLETESILKEMGVKYKLRSEVDENIPERILSIIRDEGFDCVVIGSRGTGGTKAWLLGSVSNKIATDARCPVLITK